MNKRFFKIAALLFVLPAIPAIIFWVSGHASSGRQASAAAPTPAQAVRPAPSQATSGAKVSSAVAGTSATPSVPALPATLPAGPFLGQLKAPEISGGLASAAASLPSGTVMLEQVYRAERAGRIVKVFDRVMRVEGRRYPAIRVVQEVGTDPATGQSAVLKTTEMVADQILVNLAPGVTLDQVAQAAGVPLTLRRVVPGTGTAVAAFDVASPADVDAVRSAVALQRGLVNYVEPDHIVRANVIPNDPKYTDGSLWGMNNTGQSSGTADADVDAPEGWDTRTSALATLAHGRSGPNTSTDGPNELVIAVVDTGVRYTHEDIAANMWKNPGESGGGKESNGIDDDGNGVIDDVHGVNAVAGTGDPMDDHFHGTHCAGTIAGVGNNGKGVAGIAWNAKIAACKFLASDGSGANSDASEALWYAWEQAGADVISCSWGGGSESTEVTNQIRAAGKNGAVVVVAAGNDNTDLEETGTYPAASQADNIVTVAATTRTDARSGFSNYNYGWCNVGAPGSDITSLGTKNDSDYSVLSGTSMATPLTAGILGLLRAQYPGETYGQIINRLYRGVDAISALNLKVQTGGRVNFQKSLTATSSAPFNDSFSAASMMPGSAPHSLRTANFAATAEVGEPAHGVVAANKTVWYQWTAPATATYIVSTKGSAYNTFAAGSRETPDTYGTATLDTTLGVYTGSAVNSLTTVAQNDDYDAAGTLMKWSRINFSATAGTTYYFAVGTNPSATVQEGMIILSISQPPGNDAFASAITIGSIPFSSDSSNLNALTETGEPKLHRADVSDDAPGNPTLQQSLNTTFPEKRGQLDGGGASIWWKWTPAVTGEYVVSTNGSMIDTVMGIYTGSAVNALALVAENDDIGLIRMGSENVYLSFSSIRRTFTAGTTYYIQVDGFMGRQGDVTLSISVPPANDHIANSTVVTGNLWSATVNNVGASFEDGEPLHANEYGGVSVWFKWVAPSTQDYQLTLPVSTITTALAVYTSSSPSAPTVGSLAEVASNSTPILGSNVRLSATAGQTYFIAVDGVNGKQSSSMQLSLSPTPGALLNDNFADRTRLIGTSASVGSTTSGAAYETDEPDFYGPSSQRSVWWTWTAPASGSVTFTTQYSAYNAALGVYTGSVVNALTLVASNTPPTGQSSSDYGRLTFTATRGTTYQIGVFGQASYCGNVMLNLSMTPGNALPKVETATLSASSAYADQAVTVSMVTTSDPESNPVTVAYQWQSSTDGFTWADAAGKTSSTLSADDANAGLFWRCQLSPSDATGDGNPFYTDPVAIQRRPFQLAKDGQAYSFNAGLPIEGVLAPAKRGVIINEFSKTDSASASDTGAANGEWFELLTLKDVNLAGYELGTVFLSIRFLDVALWQNIPKGTLIIIYNPTSKSAIVPADDLDASDGRIVVSGQNAACFDNGNGFPPAFPKLSGAGYVGSDAVGTGARIVLSRAFVGTVDDISYHNLAHLGGDAQFYRNPHLTASLAVRKTYRYTGASEDACESTGGWELGNADSNFATPGQPNNQAQADWIAKLRAPAPLYRFASGSNIPAGLGINATTGQISGTVSSPSGGLHSLVVERYAAGTPTSSQTVQVLVGTSGNVFSIAAGQTFTLTGDLDLGTGTLVNRGTINTNGYSLSQKQSYASWAAAYGVTGSQTEVLPSLGITKKLAFALNLDPATATLDDLPALSTADVSGSDYLTLTFRRQKGLPRVTYLVQASSDLSTWTDLNTAAQMVGSPVAIDFATEEVTVRDPLALGGTNSKRFLRLKVTDNLVTPPAPAAPSATLGIGQASLGWSPSTGAETYTVKRATTPGGPYTTIATGLTGTSYNDTTVATGTTYYYVITAASTADGESSSSAEVTVTTPSTWTPDAPTGLAAAPDAAKVALTWNAVPNASSYTVKRSTTSGSGYTDVATGLTGTSYNDTTGAPAVTYYYVVVAVNSTGTSPNSSEIASATVPYAWALDANGNWSAGASWGGTTYPNAIGSVVNFGTIITASRTVTLDVSPTVGSLTFNEDTITANSYVLGLAAGKTLTFDVISGNATINARGAGGYAIGTQGGGTIALNDTLAISAGAGGAATGDSSTVALSSQITGTGGLVLSSLSSNDGTGTAVNGFRGTVLRSTVANAFSGGVIVNSGYLTLAGNIGNLGSGTLTLVASSPSSGAGTNLALKTSGGTLPNNIVLSNTGYTSGGGNGLGINLNDPGNYTFTGSITGTAQGNQFRFTGGTGTLTLSGNASGLTTTSSNVGVRSGTLVLNNANAWAAGNSPASGWQVGNFSNNSTGGAQLLTNGFNVGGSIATNQATGSGNTSGDNVIIGGQHTTGSATFTGNVTIGRIVAGARKFQLTSAAGGTTVFLGVISDGASSGSASTVVPVEITGAGTVLLNGTNTYTGGTTVVSGATLGGTGTISGAVTVASGGKLAFTVASASKLTVGGALSFGGSNTLTITKSGTPGTGSYTLLTATGGITGTLPTLSLPVGWVATLQTSGNNLELVVTAAP